MQNIDMCCRSDIRDARTRHEVYQLIKMHKPLLVVAAPPCTSFSGWSRLNRQNPSSRAAWEKSHLNGITCSKFAASIVELQLQGNRYFLLENPSGFDLFNRPEWQRILATYSIGIVNIEQCALGLTSPLGHPIRKATPCGQGSEAGYKLSVWAQAWPAALCRWIVDGLEKLLNSRTKWSYAVHVYVGNSEDRTLPPLPPPTADPDPPEPSAAVTVRQRWGCPACKRNRDMTHPEHSRERSGPLSCKHPDVRSIHRRCPGCVKSRHGAHSSHTNEIGDCRFSDVTNRLWKHPGTRIRATPDRGGMPRDPSQRTIEDNPVTTDKLALCRTWEANVRQTEMKKTICSRIKNSTYKDLPNQCHKKPSMDQPIIHKLQTSPGCRGRTMRHKTQGA
eukprot:2958405-Amphidinium_carterae.1